MSKPGWQSKLSRPISLKTGTKLETLADARAFILDMLPESDHDRSSWQHATELLIEAAERGGSMVISWTCWKLGSNLKPR